MKHKSTGCYVKEDGLFLGVAILHIFVYRAAAIRPVVDVYFSSEQ